MSPMSARQLASAILCGTAAAAIVAATCRHMLSTRQRVRRRSMYRSTDGGILLSSDRPCGGLPDVPTWKIAVTGGPCSGKSSCMASLTASFQALGYRVFVVPEVATLLINGGLDFGGMTNEKRLTQQRVILQTIMMLEDAFCELATFERKPCVVLCDRGTMDGKAYCTPQQWQQLLQSTGYREEELRDTRYHAVVHLVTAAVGASEFYTTANNTARRETVDEAAALDTHTRNAWNGHRAMGVFDNSTSFDAKIERVLKFLQSVMRAGATLTDSVRHDPSVVGGARHRVAIENLDTSVVPTSAVRVLVETIPLIPSISGCGEVVVIRSSVDGFKTFFHVGNRVVGTSTHTVSRNIKQAEAEAIIGQQALPRPLWKRKDTFSFFDSQRHVTLEHLTAPSAVRGSTFVVASPSGPCNTPTRMMACV